MAQPLDDVTLHLRSVTERELDVEAHARVKADLGVPPGLRICQAELAGRLYGRRWAAYTVNVIGVPYRVEGWTPAFAPGWPYMALDNLPGGAALVIQIWGIRATRANCPVAAEMTWQPGRGIDYRIRAANLGELTQEAWETARAGLDLLTMAQKNHGRPPRSYPVPDSAIIQGYRDFLAEHGAPPTQEQLVQVLAERDYIIRVRTLQRRCERHGGWSVWPATAP